MAFLRLFSMLAAGGTLVACGVLGGGIPVYAATNPHVRHVRHLEHLAHLRNTRNAARARPGRATETAAAPRPRAGAGKPRATARGHAAKPWTIEIPSIGLTADLMTLGDPDGLDLPVPPLSRAAVDAGWYRFTSVPGTAGNSVIVGHVDTYVGPAVFYNLYQLRRRDLVYVNVGGTRQRFAVSSVRELAKVNFPVNQVFGTTARPVLWLITCGGAFDYQSRHYLDNIVVSATWQPLPEKTAPEKRARRDKTKHARPRAAPQEHHRAMPAAKRLARNEFS
jgi:LPXTG-site transpeptidase (sortase) family protein